MKDKIQALLQSGELSGVELAFELAKSQAISVDELLEPWSGKIAEMAGEGDVIPTQTNSDTKAYFYHDISANTNYLIMTLYFSQGCLAVAMESFL